MFKNCLKTAFRSIKYHRTFSLLNILGLSIGICCSILIFLWVADELSYDQFNANEKNIFRITSDITESKAAVIPVPMWSALKNAIPGIINVTRLKATGSIFTVNNRKFEEKKGLYADTNFLRIFSYPLMSGTISYALSSPENVVITASLARKYFGTTDAVGRIILADNDIKTYSLTVCAVLHALPA